MESILVARSSKHPVFRYLVAIGASLGGLLLRMAIASLVSEKVPYITFFPAVVLASTVGGLGPGLVTTLTSAVLADLFILRPTGSLTAGAQGDYPGLILFLAVGSLISFTADRLLRATQHENALRALFQQTLTSIGDAVISTDVHKRIRLLNPVAEELTGWSQAEAKGKPIEHVFRIVKEGSDTPAEIPIDTVLQTGTIVGLANHTELLTRDGRRVPIDDSGSPIRDAKGAIAGAVLVFRDITQRREGEIALQKAERSAREILESITDAFILFDADRRIAQLNPIAAKLLGRPVVSLIGTSETEGLLGALRTTLNSRHEQAVKDRVPAHFEIHDEEGSRWFDVSAYPSGGGELAVYLRDITARKQDEVALRRLNEDLQQFTFAATHDLREPLRMMTVYAQMLERRLGPKLDAESHSYIELVVSNGQRVSRLIDGLLEFSRLGDAESNPAPVSAQEALQEALGDLQIVIAESHASVTYDSLPHVFAEHVPLCQLFQNLVANALKYRRPETAPVVRISGRQEGAECIFSVQDDGIGIPAEYFSTIFLPFKRLHGAEVSGAGIGLATCKRIVERYGGRIWVESEQGKGSTFLFTLPAVHTATQADAR